VGGKPSFQGGAIWIADSIRDHGNPFLLSQMMYFGGHGVGTRVTQISPFSFAMS
jgi:hypothetical protein